MESNQIFANGNLVDDHFTKAGIFSAISATDLYNKMDCCNFIQGSRLSYMIPD
jgi:hypothetical protein